MGYRWRPFAGAVSTVLLWWREQLGSHKLAELTPALITEYRNNFAASSYMRARPQSKRSIIKGEPRQYKRSASDREQLPGSAREPLHHGPTPVALDQL